MSTVRPSRRLRALGAALLLPTTLALAACGSDSGSEPAASGPADELRLGYFANLTHAAALIGVEQGYITDELGDTTLTTQVFNAGPDEVEALFAGALDAAYIGPSPTINAYGQSDGDAIRIISGAASGGAQLVVREGIDSPEDLAGTTLASPQLGNTQDVALRTWLTSQGLENSVEGGGDVTITPTKNSDIVTLFADGQLDGAWVPEPFASVLVLEHGGKVLVDEADLWPEGRFVTTHLIVRTEFLEQHPETVDALLRANVQAVQYAETDPAGAATVINAGLETAGSSAVPAEVLDRALSELTVTYDPVASTLAQSAEDAVTAGTSPEQVDLEGIYDLAPLNAVLTEDGLPTVSAGGLGTQ